MDGWMDKDTYIFVDGALTGHGWHDFKAEGLVEVRSEFGLRRHPIRLDGLINCVSDH